MIVFGAMHLRRILGKIIMKPEFIDPRTRIPRSIGRLSASALSHHSLCWEAFITNIGGSDFSVPTGRPFCPKPRSGAGSNRLASSRYLVNETNMVANRGDQIQRGET